MILPGVYNQGKTTLRRGLVGVWEFDEASGSTAYCANNALLDATNNGATVNQTGKIGKCYDFDGSDDYVRTPAIANPTLMSISVWFFADTLGDSNAGRILHTGYSETLNTAGSGEKIDIQFYRAWSTAYGRWYYPGSSLSLSAWNHIVILYDGSSTSNDPVYYQNGIQKTPSESTAPSGSIVNTAEVWTIGDHKDLVRSFDGKIDQVAVWSRILSAAEVAALYNSGNGLAFSNW